MSYSIEGSSHACYNGTTCLINKFGIRNEKELQAAEGIVTVSKASLVGNAIFKRVQKSLVRPRPMKSYTNMLAQLYHEVNMLHPFREGNGRTQRAFFAQLIREAGYEINFSTTDRDLLTFAVIQAAGGVIDHLQAFFYANLSFVGKE